MSILKKSIVCVVSNAVFYGLITNTVLAWSSGPPAYRTGAPCDNEMTCNADSCHNSSSLNSGSAIFSIKPPTAYSAGKTVKIKVAFSNSSGKRRGFEMTALDANGDRVGTFKKIGKTTRVISSGDSRGCDKADEGKYIEQSTKGVKKKSWVFKWTPPSSATDPITFYAAGCDADGDAMASNDYVYTTTAEINASIP